MFKQSAKPWWEHDEDLPITFQDGCNMVRASRAYWQRLGEALGFVQYTTPETIIAHARELKEADMAGTLGKELPPLVANTETDQAAYQDEICGAVLCHRPVEWRSPEQPRWTLRPPHYDNPNELNFDSNEYRLQPVARPPYTTEAMGAAADEAERRYREDIEQAHAADIPLETRAVGITKEWRAVHFGEHLLFDKNYYRLSTALNLHAND